MIEVIDRQRRQRMDKSRWREFAEIALGEIGVKGEGVTIVFVSDRAAKDLNRRFRRRDAATDVLSFPTERAPFEETEEMGLGDVVISVERAAAQSAEHGLSFDAEVAQLILHGLLHLCGYDHETDNGEMNRLELRLRRRLGI